MFDMLEILWIITLSNKTEEDEIKFSTIYANKLTITYFLVALSAVKGLHILVTTI